jgi:hypothetical protein
MEAVHGFIGDWVSPTGIVAWTLRDALRGEHVDGVRDPQRLQISEDAGVELQVVLFYFST